MNTQPVHYPSEDDDSARWLEFPFRRGDIVISARSKSGTTWMQMICALLVFQTTDLPRPLSVLIAAMGGEGGGVLASWVIAAASAHGFPVQGTSIPGLAQRTGATTYYIEVFPVARKDLAGREPVLGLYPMGGTVDLVVASELIEAGRAMQNGFVTPDCTTLIASSELIPSRCVVFETWST